MGLEKLKRKGDYLMSNFKIVCGVKPGQETIINLNQVKQIFLSQKTSLREVVVEDINDNRWRFETDLTSLRQVSLCLHSKEIVISFSFDFLSKSLNSIEEDGYRIGDETLNEIGIVRVGDGFALIREEKI